MEFFRHREGEWDSWRVTHHLAFRRAESGESRIQMQCIEKDDQRIIDLCKDWDTDPEKAQGGCYVTWRATMAWDQEGENHEGSTVFALVPDDDDVRKGRILRDRGYAEIVPIAGTYYMDENDDLNLETPYEGGAVEERFSFDGPDVVNRMSTVRRFGGFATATFATEQRVGADTSVEVDEELEAEIENMLFFNFDSEEVKVEDVTNTEGGFFTGKPRYGNGASRWGTATGNTARPPANSAFGSGFSAPLPQEPESEDVEKVGDVPDETEAAARKAGIDLSKVPPSMRDDFVASFNAENDNGSQDASA